MGSAIKAVEKGKKKALVEETPVQQKPVPKVEVSEETVKATSVSVEEHKPDPAPTNNQSSVEKGTKKAAHTPVAQQKKDLEPVVKKEESKDKRQNEKTKEEPEEAVDEEEVDCEVISEDEEEDEKSSKKQKHRKKGKSKGKSSSRSKSKKRGKEEKKKSGRGRGGGGE